MTLRVELNPEIEAWLAAGARTRGLSVEEYVELVLRDAAAVQREPSGQLSVEEVRIMLKAMAEGAERLAAVPTSAFTRESFYQDRR
jgi:hypothetical protein